MPASIRNFGMAAPTGRSSSYRMHYIRVSSSVSEVVGLSDYCKHCIPQEPGLL
jgi:hypothetical protein